MSKIAKYHNVVFISLVLALSSGCDNNYENTDIPSIQPPKKFTKNSFIAFVGAGENNPYWPILKTGAQRYQEDLALHEIRFFSPQRQSPKSQRDLLKNIQDPDMAGLCIHIIDLDAVRSLLEEMCSRGIRIVSIINPAPQQIRVGHAGFNDEQIGEALAEATIKVLNGKGSIMLLHAGSEHPIYGTRLAAFEKKLGFHPDVEVFAKINCQGDPSQARNIIRQRSLRYPRLSAWVTLDDWPLRDVHNIDKLLPSGCKFITFGGIPRHWDLIRNRVAPQIVAANYRELGYKAAEFCDLEIWQESRMKHLYSAPVRIVHTTNLQEYIRDWNYWSTGKYLENIIPSQ